MWQYNHTNQIELYHHNYDNNELYHYGVAGMKWGVRRKYLNTDGTLNKRGIKKYAEKGYRQDIRRADAKGSLGYRIGRGLIRTIPVVSTMLKREDNKYVNSKIRDGSKKGNKVNKARAEAYLRERQKRTKELKERFGFYD